MLPYDNNEHFGISTKSVLVNYNFHFRFAKKYIKSGSVLDVGAGFCNLKDWLPLEVNYKAIDATKWICDAGEATYCDIMDYDGEQVDYICIFGVFESFKDLKPLADKLKLIAKKEILFCFTPAADIENYFYQHTYESVIEAFGECVFEHRMYSEILGRYIIG